MKSNDSVCYVLNKDILVLTPQALLPLKKAAGEVEKSRRDVHACMRMRLLTVVSIIVMHCTYFLAVESVQLK